MLVITGAPARVDPSALAGLERDTLSLTWEERRWTRKRMHTTAGREVALALPTGSLLRPGDVLARETGWYLEVEGRPEPVLALYPRDREEAIRIAFDVGNRHFSLALEGERILVPDDTAMEQLVTRMGVAWKREETVYDPLGAAPHPH
jgi:urease accessory protein